MRAARDELSPSPVNGSLRCWPTFEGSAIDPTTARRAMDMTLAAPDKAEIYRKRQTSIEPVFGNIKANLGYRQFRLRSLPAVNSEWRLICAAHNLLKLRHTRLA